MAIDFSKHGLKLRFLLSQKFADWEGIEQDYDGASIRHKRTLERKLEKIDAYAEGLNNLPDHHLRVLYQEELKKADEEERLSLED